MSEESMKKKLLGIISIGLISGLLYGLVLSVFHILNDNYLHYKLYNLGLFEIQSYITKYSIRFIIVALLAYLGFRIVDRLSKNKFLKLDKLKPKHFTVFLFFVKFAVLYAVICLVLYDDLILLLKILARDNLFERFTKRAMIVLRLYKISFLLISLISLTFISYIISRLNLIEPLKRNLTKIAGSKRTVYAGLFVILAVISMNLSMHGYKGLNKPKGPNVLIITIDTLRADHLGTYGHKRDTSPNIDKLAEKGVLFENAISQAPWTFPSMASMHTSMYPSQVGAIDFRFKINNRLITMAEYMKNNFYNTVAIVANMVVREMLGFGQGFDVFEETFTNNPDDTTSKVTTEKAIEYITKNKDNKFFMWVHYMDPHGYYLDHEQFDYTSGYEGSLPSKVNPTSLNKTNYPLDSNDLRYITGLYDEEISYTDKCIGELIDSLSELGIEDNTIIILTADHGEEFMERTRIGHEQTLYQELISVPLIVYNPLDSKLSGKRVRDNVEVRYIAQTIFDLTGLSNSYFEGINLLNIDDGSNQSNIVYSERNSNYNAGLIGEWKLISISDENTFELYNLSEDPHEKTNQIASKQDDVVQVRSILIEKLSDFKNLEATESTKIVLDDEDVKKLKALGYLQ